MEQLIIVTIFIVLNVVLACSIKLLVVSTHSQISKELTNFIKAFLDDEDTVLIKEDRYHKYFKSCDTTMKVWTRNWPFAYAFSGRVTRKEKMIYSWNDSMPSYKIRKKIRKFSRKE